MLYHDAVYIALTLLYYTIFLSLSNTSAGSTATMYLQMSRDGPSWNQR